MITDIENNENLKDIEKEYLIENSTNCVFKPFIFLTLILLSISCSAVIIYVIIKIFMN